MKKPLYLFFFAVLSLQVIAQAPLQFNYQAVLRDTGGSITKNANVAVTVNILKGSARGTEVFSEIHNTTTNEFGLISLQIGSTSSLNAVSWDADSYFLEIEVDGSVIGVTQLLSVPYALHATTSETITGEIEETDPLFSAWDKSEGIEITESQISDLQEYLTEETQSLADVLSLNNSANNLNITELADPVNSKDAATKAYVDLLIARIEALEIQMIINQGVTDIEGNKYEIVKIGDQIWMAENLRVTQYNNGVAIPTGLNNTEWGTTTHGAYAIYNNDNDMLEAYGALYNWSAAETGNLCPTGWRVPTDSEWTVLVDYLVGQGFPNSNDDGRAGNALKSCRQVSHPDGGDCATNEHPRWDSHDTHSGFDEFGFSALPGGTRWSSGDFDNAGSSVYWWSSTGFDANNAWGRALYNSLGRVPRFSISKRNGFYVRCVRDID